MSIIPYCIFYQGLSCRLIAGKFDKNGNVLCRPDISDPKSEWKLGNIFFAIKADSKNPIPVPKAMQIYAFYLNTSYPYNIYQVKYQYDPYNFEPNTTVLIAYTIHIPNTVPLYIYTHRSEGYYLSFDSKPPEGWTQDEFYIKQLYVMTKPFSNFKCVQGMCIPDISSKKSFTDCLYPCIQSNKRPLTYKNNEPMLVSELSQNNRKIYFIITIIVIIIGVIIGYFILRKVK